MDQATTFQYFPFDYKLGSLIPDRSYAAIHDPAVKSPTLKEVAASFFNNMMRVDYLSVMPPSLAYLCQVFGRDNQTVVVPNFSPGEQVVATNYWRLNSDPPGPESFSRNMVLGMGLVGHFAMTQDLAMQAWMSSLLLGTWTAWEMLAGDLWVATLNAHPRDLAVLKGTEKRILQKAGAAGEWSGKEGAQQTARSGKDSEKAVPLHRLHDVTHGDDNLSGRMGDVLKGRFTFSVLAEVRRAYSLAFDEEKIAKSVVSTIDDALADNSLDSLSIVRNLLAHKGGIADRKYVKARNAVKGVPPLEEGQSLRLDGATVKSLIDPVVECSVKLFTAVDDWLDAEKPKT